ncbi:MAG TPA: FUSC family protein [Rhodopila sp.]
MRPLLAALRPIPGALANELGALTLHGARAREPLKAVLSVLLAIFAATMLRLDDLSWAAFSGYMVMRANLGESVPRGVMRIAGTALGAAVGLLSTPLIGDNPILLMLGLFVVSWIGTFRALTSHHSYAWLFFGLTGGMIMTQAVAAPASVVDFAATRVAEIVVGTCACLVIAALFASAGAPAGSGEPLPITSASPFIGFRDAWRDEWLRENWPLAVHSTRAALAVGLLPLVWRWLSIEDFSQTAVTSYIVMIVPAAAVREGHMITIYERMAHRTLGCLFGGAMAIAALSLFSNAELPAVLTLCAGIWIGYHIQTGTQGIGYLGTQFTLGFLITFIQGPGPVASIEPGLERLLGIFIGSAMLCLVMIAWPLPEPGEPVAA